MPSCLAILKLLEKELMESDFEGIMRLLKNTMTLITDEDKLVIVIYDVTFPKWVYKELAILNKDFELN